MDLHPPYLTNSPYSNIETYRYGYDIMKLYNMEISDKSNEAKFIRLMAENKIRELDFQLGRLFTDLQLLGSLNNTAIILTADHCFNLPSDGFPNWQEKQLTKERTNVPLLIRCPWREETLNNVVDGFVESSIDFFPTILDLAEIDHPHSTYSQSCLPVTGLEFKGKDHVVSEYVFEGKYQCKIINSEYEYLREFNWINDLREKESIKDIQTNHYVNTSEEKNQSLLKTFRNITKKLELLTINNYQNERHKKYVPNG